MFEHGSSEMSGERPIKEPLKQDEGLVVDEQGVTSQAHDELMFMEETKQQKGVVEHEVAPMPKLQQREQLKTTPPLPSLPPLPSPCAK